MKIDQINAFLENTPSTFADMAVLLAGNGINILACSLTDEATSGTGNLQMIVNDTGKSGAVLEANGFKVSC